jgi:DNA-binding NarL/FixJ family response regulator
VNAPTRVLLVDDHTIVRASLRALLAGMPDVSIIAEAGDGREAIELARSHRPDVVLMDISLPGLNGLEATARLTKELPGALVLILSMHASEQYVARALRAGAAGYLLKDAAPQELAAAIATLKRGETYVSPSVSRSVLDDQRGFAREYRDPLDRLTPRQREIVQLIAEGKSTKEISYLLKVSVKTVETHRSQLMDRLEIHDVPGLVRFAISSGLVASDR